MRTSGRTISVTLREETFASGKNREIFGMTAFEIFRGIKRKRESFFPLSNTGFPN